MLWHVVDHAEASRNTSAHRCPLPSGRLATTLGGICSESGPWLQRLLPFFAALTPARVVYVNVGANKGFNVAYLLDLLSTSDRAMNVTTQAWFGALKRYADAQHIPHAVLGGHHGCGVCDACKSSPTADGGSRLRVEAVDVHAFELLDANARWLENAFRVFGLAGRVIHRPVGAESGPLQVETRGQLGFEGAGAITLMSDARGGHLQWHNSTSLDDYLAEAGVRRVHLLSVDAEKYDLPVLWGLRRSLTARAVDVVEFEYSRDVHMVPRMNGHMNGTARVNGWTLKATLAQMHELGYACWWQSGSGRRGCLYPASGRCWREQFECYLKREVRKSELCVDAGNLLCAHGHARALMHEFATECAR